ncbi:hypothetical protein BEN30_16035 [Magnetovibrio blakemorei]|uniref:Aminoglycoside N(3)-acetyltransferase n=2 Tax=Magnetovibrio blakemorei TaxID=28181 RepID=A0A1E5Q498_9PROT|nr:hypothetical protein BEN30_16035 [Magnetovibrio blakemorei]
MVPTYTYSFTKDKKFDPATTPSDIGPFTEFFRTNPGVVRSLEPMFSVAAQGPLAEELLRDLPKTSFGPDCVYDRMWTKNAVIANIGLTIEYLTFLHYVERELEVSYRYDKPFEGYVLSHGKWERLTWYYFVRIYKENTKPDLKEFRSRSRAENLLKPADLGKGFVEAMRCRDIKSLVTRMLDEDPWSFIQGPKFDIRDEMKT